MYEREDMNDMIAMGATTMDRTQELSKDMDTICPICGKRGAKRTDSLDDRGLFKYGCKSCGSVYSLSQLYRIKSNKLKRMKELSNNGVLSKFIPIVLKMEDNELSEEQKTFLQNLKLTEIDKTETLSKEQKEFIYKWGVMLNVPVEYLAPYVPCSYYACQKELDKYKKDINKVKIATKPEISNRDREFDRIFLNKFIS